MGRMMPVECSHGVTVDWGDFGPCQDCDEHGDESCPNMPECSACAAERDALEWSARQGEEAIRQLSQLRVTLPVRIDHAERMSESQITDDGMTYWDGRAVAYRDVLSLLGPEPAWTTDDDGEPF